MNMQALSESERCQFRWNDGEGTRCTSAVEYRVLIHNPNVQAHDLCSHHTTMTEDVLALLHISHGRTYIGIGSTSRDDPRFDDPATDGALDARMESE